MRCLHRAVVSLPPELVPRDRFFAERHVFFEAEHLIRTPNASHPTQALERLLAIAWGVDTAHWTDDGVIYNCMRECDLRDQALGGGDVALLECGWGGPERIHYAHRDACDLFVSPRWRLRLDAAWASLGQLKAVAR